MGKGALRAIIDVLPGCSDSVMGFAMCILHEGTWSTAPICYLEDLFVDAANAARDRKRRSSMP
jgi:hypothetical protein